jgi:hypothetical protein
MDLFATRNSICIIHSFFPRIGADFSLLATDVYIFRRGKQSCQMVCFQTKNPNLGKFLRVLEWKMLVYFMAIRNILQSFGVFYGQLAMLW